MMASVSKSLFLVVIILVKLLLFVLVFLSFAFPFFFSFFSFFLPFLSFISFLSFFLMLFILPFLLSYSFLTGFLVILFLPFSYSSVLCPSLTASLSPFPISSPILGTIRSFFLSPFLFLNRYIPIVFRGEIWVFTHRRNFHSYNEEKYKLIF